jgi:hypothetical protein
VKLTGEGGLLQQLTKRVLESALEGELTGHLGHEHGERAGRGPGEGSVVIAAQDADASGTVNPIGDCVTAAITVDNGRFAVQFRRPLEADSSVLQANFLGGYGADPCERDPPSRPTTDLPADLGPALRGVRTGPPDIGIPL